MKDILVSGSLAYDHIMNFQGLFRERFLPDKLHAINISFGAEGHAEHFGGTAGNIAYNLALLGETPRLIATAGNDFGRYAERLRLSGIDSASVRIHDDVPTATAFIITDTDNNQIAAFARGAMRYPYGDFDPGGAALAIIAPGCLDDMRILPSKYRGAVPFLFDPGQAISGLSGDRLKDGMTGAEAVFVNDYEFSLMSRATGWEIADVVAAAKTLIITLGKDGSRVITSEGETVVAAVPTDELRDPTGAGDAFRAGYIKGMRASLPPAACARIGSAVAVYAVETLGTQNHRFDREGLAARYQQAYGETIPL